jgi:hypothetical protein
MSDALTGMVNEADARQKESRRQRLEKQPLWVRDYVSGLEMELRRAYLDAEKANDALVRLVGEHTDPNARFSIEVPAGHRLDAPDGSTITARIDGIDLDISISDGRLLIYGIAASISVRPVSTYEVLIGAAE